MREIRLITDPALLSAVPDPPMTAAYSARSGAQWKMIGAACCFIVIGFVPMGEFRAWLGGGPSPSNTAFITIGMMLLSVLVTVGSALNLIFGLPRLRADGAGVTIVGLLGTRRVLWSCLGSFETRQFYAGRRMRQMANAKVVGVTSGNRWERRNFHISDYFDTPVPSIVEELNAIRSRSLGPAALNNIAAPSAVISPPRFRQPWLSYTLLAALVGIFYLQGILSPKLSLIGLGAVSRNAVLENGEWYRLFTAPLLHANPLHILGNGIALIMAGFALEWLIGRAWFFTIFFFGAVGGSLMSIALNAPYTFSVGASGALMALLAAAFVASFRLPSGSRAQARSMSLSMRILLPSLLPASGVGPHHIDYSAHFGGLLTGALIAFLLLKQWKRGESSPPFSGMAMILAIIGGLVFAVCWFIALVSA